MSSTSEVGHAKNVAHLQKLTQQVSVYSIYNPPVPNLTVANLQALYATANAKLAEVEDKRNANKNTIALRQNAFENLKTTCTHIINRLKILGLLEGTLDQAKSLNRLFRAVVRKKQFPQRLTTKNNPPTTPFLLPDSHSPNKQKISEFFCSCWQPFPITVRMKTN